VKYGIGIAIVLVTLMGAETLMAAEQSSQPKEMEYKLKAVCMFNLLKFTKWPGESSDESRERKNKNGDYARTAAHDPSIVIGILGEDPFGDAFTPLQKKTVQGKSVIIKKLGSLEHRKDDADRKAPPIIDSNSLKDCHVLFVSSSEKDHTEQIITSLKSAPVLTLGEAEGFLEAGGMINIVSANNKIQFEINLVALTRANLAVEPEVLRLAIRVIEK
jgi:hypothetical protein